MKRIVYFQRFFEINDIGFYHSFQDCDECLREKETSKLVWYQWVVPVYVYSINIHWDGSEHFDICPVNFKLKKNKDESWRWKRECSYSDIGKTLFKKESDAWGYYDTKYTEEKRKIFAGLKKIHDKGETNV